MTRMYSEYPFDPSKRLSTLFLERETLWWLFIVIVDFQYMVGACPSKILGQQNMIHRSMRSARRAVLNVEG
jgi:hypothetical protein